MKKCLTLTIIVLFLFILSCNEASNQDNLKFRVKWDGKYIPGVSKISPLKRFTVPVTYREGGTSGTSHVSPGGFWKFEPIKLERGVTHDTAFEEWANFVYQASEDAAISSTDFRKDILIELLNEQGTVVKLFRVYRCWVSEYQVVLELDSNANSIAIESIVLQNEGWERDVDVPEP